MSYDLLEAECLTKEANDIAGDRVFNEQLANTLINGADGKYEKVAAAGEIYIKRRLRERSIVRRNLDFEGVDESKLQKPTDDSTEMPYLWGEFQNNSRGAVSLSMKDTADSETFWRNTFRIQFFVISTPEYYKNTFELVGHVQDTVKNLTEDMLLDVEEEEDRRWFAGCDEAVGPIDGVGLTGIPQNFYFGEFSRETVADQDYLFSDRQVPHAMNVVNQRFAAHFRKMNRTEMGGEMAQTLFLEGDQSLKTKNIGNVPYLFTSKNHIIPDNVVYQFANADYLGCAFEYQKPTMFMEKKKRMLYFSLEEIIAVAISNSEGVIRGVFENRPS
jgi:hypothetical protein